MKQVLLLVVKRPSLNSAPTASAVIVARVRHSVTKLIAFHATNYNYCQSRAEELTVVGVRERRITRRNPWQLRVIIDFC